MNFHQSVLYSFGKLAVFYRVEMEKQLVEFNVHSGQIFILFELWEEDGISQIKLAEKTGLTAATVNRMVKSLQNNGFVVFSANKSDGRVVNVFLTPQGAALRPKIEERWLSIEEKLLINLTATEQLVLSQLFSRLIENLLPKKP